MKYEKKWYLAIFSLLLSSLLTTLSYADILVSEGSLPEVSSVEELQKFQESLLKSSKNVLPLDTGLRNTDLPAISYGSLPSPPNPTGPDAWPPQPNIAVNGRTINTNPVWRTKLSLWDEVTITPWLEGLSQDYINVLKYIYKGVFLRLTTPRVETEVQGHWKNVVNLAADRHSGEVTKTVTVRKGFSNSKQWTHAAAVTLSVTAGGKAGIPFVAEGEVSTTLEGTLSTQFGTDETVFEETEDSMSFPALIKDSDTETLKVWVSHWQGQFEYNIHFKREIITETCFELSDAYIQDLEEDGKEIPEGDQCMGYVLAEFKNGQYWVKDGKHFFATFVKKDDNGEVVSEKDVYFSFEATQAPLVKRDYFMRQGSETYNVTSWPCKKTADCPNVPNIRALEEARIKAAKH